jgi:hypothetical protein
MKLLVIAGNGLSLSMLNKNQVEGVDLSNLFSKGGDVSWPATGKPGFLSYEHCPNLWNLGARQTVTASDAYKVIEQTITAVNACCLADPSTLDDSIYIRAYRELVAYLRYLFVHYDSELQASNFFDQPAVYDPIDWLLEAVAEAAVTDIEIINFNYDAFLERGLQKKGIQFAIPLLAEQAGAKVRIHKPHGSITFCGRTSIDKAAFIFNHNGGINFTEGGIGELEVRYDGLDGHFPIVGILPPAGESDRYRHRWIRQIWDKAIEATGSLNENDLVIIYGISYWHVDRAEIDKVLSGISRRVRVVSINPQPNPQFEAVCCSLFKSYHSYSHPKQLKRMIR